MDPVSYNSMPQGGSSSTSANQSINCGDEKCPRHRPGARIPTPAAPPHEESCQDKNCPRHGNRRTVKWSETQAAQFRDGLTQHKRYSSRNSGEVSSASKQGDQIDDLVNKVQQFLEISDPPPAVKPVGTSNVKTFITTNNNSVESPYASVSSSPFVSPKKDGLSGLPTLETYDKLKLEHTLKENFTLQILTMKHGEENIQLKKLVKELQSKLEKAEQEKIKVQEKNKELIKITQDWNKVLKEYQDTIRNLKSRLTYNDLKTKQLKRMASDNAITAAKWKAKMMEALEAAKAMEEWKNASEKATVCINRQYRNEKKKILDLKRQHGVPVTDSDLESTASTTAGTLDTTMIESNLDLSV